MREAQNRLYACRFGIFQHFLFGGRQDLHGKEASDWWNRRCEAFDTERLAEELSRMGAGYYVFTLMQGRKYMAAPSETYDRIAGSVPGELCARRDLPLDLAESLSRRGIDLYLYFTGDGPYIDAQIGEKFGFTEPRRNVSRDFCEKWAAVLQEYAVRYGDRVKGWWIDGCYEWFGYTDSLLSLYADAVHRGNPRALVTMNNGCGEHLYKYFCGEGFTSGEYNDFTEIPASRLIDGSLPHILAPLGQIEEGKPWTGWCKGGLKRSREYMRDYIRRVNEAGGVVTVDIRVNEDGSTDPAQIEALSGMGAYLRGE